MASSPSFVDQAQVINGASDLFVEVFGEIGRYARSALGVVSLPRDAGVEIEVIAGVVKVAWVRSKNFIYQLPDIFTSVIVL